MPARKLERYNNFSELSVQISTIIGPLVASAFIAYTFLGTGFVIDAMSFFICATVFAAIVAKQSTRSANEQSQPQRNMFEGFKLIIRHPTLRNFIAYDALQMIGYGAFNATFLVLAQRDLQWSKFEFSWHLSIIAAFTALGAMLGASRFAEKFTTQTKLLWFAIITGCCLWGVLVLGTFPMSSILFGIGDALCVMTVAITRTQVQLKARTDHPNFLASILAARMIIIKFATLFGTGACLLLR